MKKTIRLILKLVALLSPVGAFAEPAISFDGYLALIEVVSVEKLDPSEVGQEHVIKTDLVHNPIGKVLEVYIGPEGLVDSSFPLTPPPHMKGKPEELTHTNLGFDGVFPEKSLPIGSKAVVNLHLRKDFNPRNRNFNPFRFPDRSIFYIYYGSGLGFNNIGSGGFENRLELGKAIRHFNKIDEIDEQIAYLKQSIYNENPLLSVSAVHLLKRYYPQLAEEYFDEIILEPNTPFHTRLAIDHEFCLSRGQAWVSGKQKELEPILEKEASEASKGTRLLSFRKQMIDNGSWFGGRGERE